MAPALQRRIIGTAAALAAALALAGCAVPLGSGFRIERQELSAEYIPGPQPALRVRAFWRVKNTGNQPLDAVEAGLPEAQPHARSELRVEVDGQTVPLPAIPSASVVHAAFPEPLAAGETREIAVSYELRGTRNESAGTDVTKEGFILPPGDWAPVLLRPKGTFAASSDPPKKWQMSFRVPAGWRVHSSGTLKGVDRGKRDGAQSAVFRFTETRAGNLPFAVGGAFQEEKLETDGRAVIFWTRQMLPADTAQRAAETAAAAAEFYDQAFGAPPQEARTLWIIECPRSSACWPVPDAALVGSDINRSDAGPALLRQVEQQLAPTWLDFQVHADWDKEPLPMGAIADYAAELAAAAREEGDARRKIVHELLDSYDYERARQPEPPVFSVMLSDPASARRFARLKSELFFFALEDEAGRDNLEDALRHLLRAYHGGVWRADDLRAAIEQEGGKELAPLFRRWLVAAGVPEAFRSRY